MTLFFNSTAPKSLEFDWQGTQLGIRVEGEPSFTYVELRGVQGIQGLQGIQGPQGIQGLQGPTGPEDIEEGSWTPQLQTNADNTEPIYYFRKGYFYRIKKLVRIEIQIYLQSKIAAPGTLIITGLPFLCNPIAFNYANISPAFYGGHSAFSSPVSTLINPSITAVILRFNRLGAFPERDMLWSDLADNSFFWIGGSYVAI